MKAVFHCDFPNCTYASEKSRSLRMHRFRAHGAKQSVPSASESQTSSVSEDSNTAEQQADHTDHNTETSVNIRTGSEAEGSGQTRVLRRRRHTAASSVASNIPCQITANYHRDVTAKKTRVTARMRPVSDADDVKKDKTLYTCNVDGCSYANENLQSLAMHKRFHYTESTVTTKKGHLSSANAVKEKKTLFTCDVDGCNYATENLQSLASHKRRHHCKERDVTESTITGKRKHNPAKSVAFNVQRENITAEYVCNSFGCGRAFYSERGLCIHKRTCQKRQAPVCKPVRNDRISMPENTQTVQSRETVADIQECHIQTESQTVQSRAATEVQSESFVSDNTSPNQRVTVYDNRSPSTTEKKHIKKSFSSTIMDLEKRISPQYRM